MAITLIGGCRGTPTPTPEPMHPIATVEPLPSDTSTPTVTVTLTPSVTPEPSATPSAVFAPSAQGKPERGCEIRDIAETWSLLLSPDAPSDAQAAWARRGLREISADVIAHNPEAKVYLLRPLDPAVEYNFLLGYRNEPLPLETGHAYRVRVHHDLPGQPPSGSALRLDDADGLVLLGVSVRETEGAQRRIFGADRAGFAVRQLPTHCRYAPVNDCGFELRAAPVEFSRGEDSVVVTVDTAELLGRDPPFLITLYASHYRLWVRDAPCPDPTDWVLSYRIARVR